METNTNESISRENATDAEWFAWWRANYRTVLARRTLQLTFAVDAKGLVKVPCAVCGQTYLTSTSERHATCSDCEIEARDWSRKVTRETVVRARKAAADRQWALDAHAMGWCDHEGRETIDGQPWCYLAPRS